MEEARKIYPEIHFRRVNTIVHFSEEQVCRTFREVFRVLQPGGILLFTYHIGEETIHLEEFLGKKVDIDFMFFTTDFIFSSLKKSGFEKIETIEREPYPGVEYQRIKKHPSDLLIKF